MNNYDEPSSADIYASLYGPHFSSYLPRAHWLYYDDWPFDREWYKHRIAVSRMLAARLTLPEGLPWRQGLRKLAMAPRARISVVHEQQAAEYDGRQITVGSDWLMDRGFVAIGPLPDHLPPLPERNVSSD